MNTTLQIEILNPKATQLLENLADLKLISIRKLSNFEDILEKLRAKSDEAPTLEEITEEVEKVRAERYEKKKKESSYN